MSPNRKTLPGIRRGSSRYRCWPAMLAAAWLTSVAGTAPASPDVSFLQKVIVTGDSHKQAVLTGYFLGGSHADIAVITTDRRGESTVRLYTFEDDNWTPGPTHGLRDQVVLVDVARIDGRDALLTFDNATFMRIDPVAGNEQVLFSLHAAFEPAADNEIVSVDVTRDLNRDGRDDIIMPAPDGFWIALQRDHGEFAGPVKLGPAEPFIDAASIETEQTYRQQGISAQTLPWYLGRAHELDYDADGRNDLAFWAGDHFAVYRQQDDGRFAQAPVSFAPGVPFDADGVYALMFGLDDENSFALLSGFRKKTTHTVLHSIRDLNNDDIADIVTLTVTGRSILRQKSMYSLYYGTVTRDGLVYSKAADARLSPKGKSGRLQASGYASQHFADFDNDGRTDILFQHVAIGALGMARALVGNSVPINLEVYRGAPTGFSDASTTRRKIRRFAPFDGPGNVFFPAVLLGDVSGDGRADLLVGHGPERLHVYESMDGPELFSRKPLRVSVDMPADERNVRLADLNGDQKQDLLVHIAPTSHAPDTPNRLITLIAR